MKKSVLARIVMLLALISCLPGATNAIAAKKLVLQLPWTHQFQFAGYYMAQERGYFSQAGLDVEIRPIDQATDPVSEVLSGKADFGVTSSGLLIEYSLGKPVVAVAAIFQQSPTVFLTLESSGIRSLEDFKGRRVMLSPGYQSLPLIALLNQEGLLNQIIPLQTSFDHRSLLHGETDVFNAYRTNEPHLLEESGLSVNIIDPRDYGIHFYGDILFTTGQFAEQNPATLEKFRTAALKGWEYALAHIDETIAVIKNRYQVDKTVSSLQFEAAAIRKSIQPDTIDLGHQDLARWVQIAHHLIAIGQLPGNFQLHDDFIYRPRQGVAWAELRPWVIGAGIVFSVLLAFLTLLSRARFTTQKTLRQLEASEKKYRDLVSHVPGLIYSYDTSSGQITFSPDTRSVLSYPVEAFHKNPQLWHDSIHPEDLSEVEYAFASTALQKTCEVEYRIKDQTGQWLWLNDRFIKRQDPEQHVIIDGVATDISDKKWALEQQQQHDQMLREALDAVSDGVWEWHIQEGEAFLDSHSRQLLGLPQEQKTKSADLFRLVDKEDLPRVVAALEAHIDGHSERLDQVFRIHRPDGTLVWIRGRGKVIERDLSGKAARMIGTYVDITQRQLAEEKRLESEKRFRMLIEQVANLAIQGYDEQRRVIFWNKASEKLYGYTEAEALGRRLEDLIIPPGMRQEVVQGIRLWLEQGIPIPASELVLTDKEGQEIPVFSSHVLYETSSHRELFCIDIDTKPMKEAEQKRLELEEQLRQVYKMEAIGIMAGGIAHDFNNSLAVILGNVELSLLKASGDSRLANHLGRAKEAILRAKQLVEQILIYSRQGVLHITVLNLDKALNDTIKMLRHTIPATVHLVFENSALDHSIKIAADATQIQQIIMNLCNNAVHAMQEKGTLGISLDTVTLIEEDFPPGKQRAPGDYAKLAVTDTGCGISPDLLEKIFDPFFTTKEVGEGTGMGLAVVQGIVESHGGFIIAESIPSKGSRFEVYFPLVTGAASSESAANAPSEAEMPGGNENILLVDDEEMLTDIGRQFLEDAGYKVTTANDSRQALALFRKDPDHFDLVITDQTMPHLTGKELAKELLKLRPELPIILCSGRAIQDTENNFLSVGIREYCQKPLNLSHILKAVRKNLDLKPN